MQFQTILFFSLLSSFLTFALELIKEPNQVSITISENTLGLKLLCYINNSNNSNDSDSENPLQIRWFISNPGSGDTEIDNTQHVKVNSNGQSVLSLSEDIARKSSVKCRLGDHEQVWEVSAHFKLNQLPTSETFVEGQDVILRCRLRPHAAAEGELTFAWFRVPEADPLATGEPLGDSALEEDEIEPHLRIVLTDEGRASVLRIEDVNFEDRGIYRCEVHLTDGEATSNDTTQSLVRVKDSYAAVYPCIGVAAEVIFLSVIYYRHRNDEVAV